MATTKAYTAGHFEFNLDGSPTTAWLKSVDGGAVKGLVVTEAVGPDELSFRHLATVEIEPMTVEVALSAGKPILQWIKDSWTGNNFSRRNGSIVHGDFKYKATFEQSFLQALITETAFPALDASNKDAAYLTVKLHPEQMEIKKGSGTLQGVEGSKKVKMWSPSMFRLDIDGLDCSHVNKIDAITVKQKITQMYFGSNRYPELEPTGIEFPNLTIYMSAAHAQGFIDWHQKVVVVGDKDPSVEKTGAIEFLNPAGSDPLFTIKLDRVGINGLSFEKSEANAEAIKRVKVELRVDSMDLEFSSGFE